MTANHYADYTDEELMREWHWRQQCADKAKAMADALKAEMNRRAAVPVEEDDD